VISSNPAGSVSSSAVVEIARGSKPVSKLVFSSA
jgi:hypothetical protein